MDVQKAPRHPGEMCKCWDVADILRVVCEGEAFPLGHTAALLACLMLSQLSQGKDVLIRRVLLDMLLLAVLKALRGEVYRVQCGL